MPPKGQHLTLTRSTQFYSIESNIFSLKVENEQADAVRDGQTCLARPNTPAQTGTGKKKVFPVQLTMSRIGNHSRLIHTLLYVMTNNYSRIAPTIISILVLSILQQSKVGGGGRCCQTFSICPLFSY